MRKLAYTLLVMVLSITYSSGQNGATPATDPLYDVVFYDDFNSPILDTSKWATNHTWGQAWGSDTLSCWSNHALFHMASIDPDPFDTSNRTISGGFCDLIAKNVAETKDIWSFPPCSGPPCNGVGCLYNEDSTQSSCMVVDHLTYKYSSAMLRSKKNFKYGYFEMRFRFPLWSQDVRRACHPSFWLYSADPTITWSEIDVFEIKGDSGYITNTIHVDDTTTNNTHSVDSYPDDIYAPGGNKINMALFNRIGCWWTPESISFYKNDTLIRTSNRDTNQYLLSMPILIENTINQFFSCLAVDSNFLPKFEIDWVKVWQPELACDSDKVYTNITQATFNSKLYKSLTIAGTGYSATFNNGTVTAEGSDYVLLQEGFEAGSNMEMLINTEPCWSGMKMEKGREGPIPPQPSSQARYSH
jgi:hypothetical protein